METRVYGIKISEVGEININELTTGEFMDLAEEQGLVWGLKGFERDFNQDFINQSDLFIKFVTS